MNIPNTINRMSQNFLEKLVHSGQNIFLASKRRFYRSLSVFSYTNSLLLYAKVAWENVQTVIMAMFYSLSHLMIKNCANTNEFEYSVSLVRCWLTNELYWVD